MAKDMGVQEMADAVLSGQKARDVIRGDVEPVLMPPKSDVPDDYGTEYFRLGCLRPKDEFRFVREVPYDGIGLADVYRVIPAQRGFIKFTDDKSAVYSVPIDYAFGIRVRAENISRAEKVYYFYPGDRAKSKDTGALGVVQFSRGQGYLVLFDGMETPQWVPGGSIMLIDKDLTTRNYIVYDSESDRFVVGYASIRSDHETVLNALEWLYENNKPAHHRLSIFISRLSEETDQEVFDDLCWVDDDVLNYLYDVDSKVWDPETVSRVSELLKMVHDEGGEDTEYGDVDIDDEMDVKEEVEIEVDVEVEKG